MVENILHQILDKLGSLDEKVETIDRKIGSMETKIESIDSRLESMESRLDSMEARLDSVELRLDHIERRLDHVESVQHQMMQAVIETNETVKRIENEQQKMKAVLNNHSYSIDLLNREQFYLKTEVEKLKNR